MVDVIVNADDFGHDENRTLAILEGARRGIVTATTAMANMDWFDRAMAMAKGTPLEGNIGLHLNFTQGRPLTEAMRECRFFCDAAGEFTADFHRSRLRRFLLPRAVRQLVADEAEAQMVRYRDSGATLFHLDSHHHSHTDPSIAALVLPVARRLGFKTVRRSRDLGLGLTPAKRLYKAFVNRRLGSQLKFAVDRFCSFPDLEAVWATVPDGWRVEVMTHPLYATDGKLDLKGEFTDSYAPFGRLEEFFAAHRDRLRLVPYV